MTRSNAPAYQTGFANHFATEAVEGALPVGRNSPQRPALGLYAEQLSGAAFTARATIICAAGSIVCGPRPSMGPISPSRRAACAPAPSPRPRPIPTACVGTP